jgi:hypothetical protein
MSWKEHNAIKRIYNVFNRNKKTIYPEDVNALKVVMDAIDEADKKHTIDNILFAKLLSIQLRQNLEFYGSMEVALKKIDDELKKPLNYQIQILHKTLNHVEFDVYLKSLGLNVNFITTKEEEKKNNEIIFEKQKEISKKFIKDWSLEVVEKSFYKTANELIKNVNYYE